MENPHFKNQPKAEVEKTPQENEGLLNEQEQESGKRENIILEIDGQKIEAVKYYFEYPERIQKEAGILGYERTQIPKENLYNLFKSTLSKNNLSLPDEIKDYASAHRFLDKLNEKGVNMTKEEIQMYSNIDHTDRDMGYELLNVLSNGEYPEYCHNHKLSFHLDKKGTERHKKFFKKDFFLGKIYDLEKIKEEKKYAPYAFSNRKLDVDGSADWANITVYNSSNPYEKISPGKYISLQDVLDYEDEIKNGEAYACTTYSGLNTSPSDFFWDLYYFRNQIGFGFSYKLSGLMREYFEKSLCAFIQQLSNEDYSKSSINEVGSALFLDSSLRKKSVDLSRILEENGIDKKITDQELNILWNRSDDYRTYAENGREGMSELHSFLPIFIGHKKIPQLSWGHAKYAHYFNDKSFNFFKFKHADHLPVKKEMNSSDS